MKPEQQMSILSIAPFAAFADGNKDDRERERIRQLAESLAEELHRPDLARLYQDVLLKRVKLSDAAAALEDADHRQLAYEMAVCVCDADGSQSDAERGFLGELKNMLKLNSAQADAVEREADALAAEPLAAASGAALPALVKAQKSDQSSGLSTQTTLIPNIPESELDKSILNYSILNGALELLPQSWASMAIIPLQIKMVYRIGKAYGHELDKGHIKEFLATVGVGLTSQYLEQIGRKLLGGLLGKAAGRMVGKIGRSATGMAFSFASTYALGQVAKRYYAGGRKMSTALLQDSFRDLLGPAKQLQAQYLPQIEQKAGTIDAGQIMAMVRNS
jgi:uncharacterized protein (DUF697 family)/tellurite resistance protein